MRRTLLTLALLLFVAGCAGTNGADAAKEAGGAPATTAPDPVQTALDAGAPLNEVRVIARRFAFEPATITVKKGDVVKLTLSSEDTGHGLALPAYGVDLPVPGGESHTITFVADRQGEFPFYCSVYCGSGHGSMRGLLVVE